MTPDEVALRHDLEAPPFRLGERRGRWRCARLRFPLAYFEVAAPVRANSPSRFLLRLNTTGYKGIGPTGELWHGQRDIALPLEHRPRGPNGVLLAFQQWGIPCFYNPIDRLARDHWPHQFAEHAWGPDCDITTYLEAVHGVLEDSDYLGAALSEGALDLQPDALASAL